MLVARSGTFDCKLKEAVEMDSLWAITLTLSLSCCCACYITVILSLNSLSFFLILTFISHIYFLVTPETSNKGRLFTSMNACVKRSQCKYPFPSLKVRISFSCSFNSVRLLSTQNYFYELSIIPILITHFRSYAQGFNKKTSRKSSFEL